MHEALYSAYSARFDILSRIAINIELHLKELLQSEPRIDRIAVRAKSIDRFVKKATKTNSDGILKYSDPINEIQDQLGARVVVFYKSDIVRVESIITRYFTSIEHRTLVPESEQEFGYFGRHLILTLPSDVLDDGMNASDYPSFFEIQIKTLFQHAWSEADHDLGYKPGDSALSADQKRKIAFTSAQAWGADEIFEELFQKRNATLPTA